VSAFQAKPTHAFKQRVTDSQGNRGTFSTGTSDPRTAEVVRAMLTRLKGQRRWDVLDAIVAKRAKLKDVFDADQRGELDAFMAQLADVDLSPLVTEWALAGALVRYVAQVRRLIPEGERFPASSFTRKAISAHLAKLPDARAHKSKRSASNSTRNRHKAALSQFGKWLVEREVIQSNPVRDVSGRRENPARMVSYDWSQSRALIDALPEPYRSLEALMAGTGMEWSAVADTRRSDVDFDARKVHAKGGKNRHRNRVVRVTESWAWEIFAAHAKRFMPAQQLFDLDQKTAIAEHRKALEAAGLPDSTLHDWRHTYAVNWVKAGKPLAVLKRQLGHAPNSTQVERVYAVWIVTDSDYDATTLATTAKPKSQVTNAK
jgi:integrase